jgi:hypothetical protein
VKRVIYKILPGQLLGYMNAASCKALQNILANLCGISL